MQLKQCRQKGCQGAQDIAHTPDTHCTHSYNPTNENATLIVNVTIYIATTPYIPNPHSYQMWMGCCCCCQRLCISKTTSAFIMQRCYDSILTSIMSAYVVWISAAKTQHCTMAPASPIELLSRSSARMLGHLVTSSDRNTAPRAAWEPQYTVTPTVHSTALIVKPIDQAPVRNCMNTTTPTSTHTSCPHPWLHPLHPRSHPLSHSLSSP